MIGRPSSHVVLTCLLASTAIPSASFAQQPSGNVVKVDPAVNASGPGGARLLELEGAVFMGDEIVASPYGLAQIRFVDDTRMVIGPNSRLRIDEFVFSSDLTAQEVTITALKGAFRFISGNSPSEAYSIRTPTMTIGVRGTVVDFYAAVNGTESGAIFHDGSGDVCDAAGTNCVVAVDDCRLFVAPQGGGPGEATGIDRELRLQVRFPFVGGQGGLDAAFQADTGACGNASNIRTLGTPPDNNDKLENRVFDEFDGKEPPGDDDDSDSDDTDSDDDFDDA